MVTAPAPSVWDPHPSGRQLTDEKGALRRAQLGVLNPTRDYTPPDRLTLLFTDLGVLTPSAVSDELIQLYL